MKTDRPCRLDPDLWFAPGQVQKGQAIHICLEHCSRLEECRATEEIPTYGVLAGVAYGHDAEPLKAHKQPLPVPCLECRPVPQDPRADPSDTGKCGTNAGWARHRKRTERPCDPCRLAHNRRVTAWARSRRAA